MKRGEQLVDPLVPDVEGKIAKVPDLVLGPDGLVPQAISAASCSGMD
jgi:hypothetical protein